MTDRELMQQALEALENTYTDPGDAQHERECNAITALRERLAQPEHEPVAWMQNTTAGLYVIDHYDEWHCIPLYTTPPQRKPLSEEEIQTYRHMIDWTAEWSYINFARAIEQAHGIKEGA